MTDPNPYYKLIDGEPMISPAGLALLLDLPLDDVLAEYERQTRGAANGVMQMPAEWRKRGVRVRKETQAALGYEAGMKECIDYLASKA
ncbi:hypothetical protein SAMN05443665_105156 [Actinomadura meyerae]|uniref:Uncharacterized protein n=1 Tax=Actinomadura meyerae TaxID=240840 RepID=A0A239NXE7_9ACTN|nr:hypothetical protein [Actinomadura meyerae]SNT59113.1 hypothetical protein SAMN05443665_105156 [Actinomadura meyerae]